VLRRRAGTKEKERVGLSLAAGSEILGLILNQKKKLRTENTPLCEWE
jgi:hypothetical protein